MRLKIIGLLFFLFSFNSLLAERDSVLYKGKLYYYNTDSLHREYLYRSYKENFEGLEEYCYILFNMMDDTKRQKEFKSLECLAKKLKSNKLFLECELLRTNFLPQDTERLKREKERAFTVLLENALKEKNEFIYLRGLFMFAVFYQETAQYFHMFLLFEKFAERLEKISEDDFPWKRNGYERLAEIYYCFESYEEAYFFWQKAQGQSLGFYDQSNYRARNGLGLYYRKQGNLQKSDFYFNSILKKNESVNCRYWHEANAAYNLGINYKEQKHYKEAISLLKKSHSILLDIEELSFQERNLILMSMAGLAECYIEDNQLEEAHAVFLQLTALMQPEDKKNISPDIYRFLSKYSIVYRDSTAAINYLDTAFNLQAGHKFIYNPSHLLLARQEIYHARLELEEEQRKYYFNVLLFFFLFIFCCLLAIAILLNIYIKSRIAYRDLIRNSFHRIAFEKKTESNIENDLLDEEEKELIKRIKDLMTYEKLYKNEELTLDVLAERLNIHRNIISKVINQATGKKFNRFINEYRVEEAIRILSTVGNSVSMEWVMEEVGFRSRNPFFETFKAVTGLTPAAFVKNRSD